MARGAASILDRIQVQGRRVLDAVQAEIRRRETGIEDLRERASAWVAAIGGSAPKRRGRPPGPGASAKAATRKSPRGSYAKVATKAKKKKSPDVDWDKVLGRLPKSFTMKELERATPALKEHRQTRNIALARWSRAGAIKKTGQGKYQRVGRAAG
jgi:hypothetical protein